MAAGEDALTGLMRPPRHDSGSEPSPHAAERAIDSSTYVVLSVASTRKRPTPFREMLVSRASPSGEAKNPSSEPSVKWTGWTSTSRGRWHEPPKGIFAYSQGDDDRIVSLNCTLDVSRVHRIPVEYVQAIGERMKLAGMPREGRDVVPRGQQFLDRRPPRCAICGLRGLAICLS
jgi:hypothetical protein